MQASIAKRRAAPFLWAAVLLASCTSAADKAANEVAIARDAFNRGDAVQADQHIRRALALRDDQSEDWLLAAQISVVRGDGGSAFQAYENVAQLDQSNVEALTRLCQLALAFGDPQRAEPYADRLAVTDPQNPLVGTIRAGILSARGKPDDALAAIDKVIAANPGDIDALVQKARILAGQQRYDEAAKVIDYSLTLPGDFSARLRMLVDYRQRGTDRAALIQALARRANAAPTDWQTQVKLADLLYEQGDTARADAVISRLAQRAPRTIAIIQPIVSAWRRAQPPAVPPDGIVAAAAQAPLTLRLAYLLYANEIGRGDVTLKLLAPRRAALAAASGPTDLIERAALAYADGLAGNPAGAIKALDAILAIDPQQPDALFARGQLKARTGDRRGAIEDLRQAVAQANDNSSARLALADVLARGGDTVLAESALRDGIDGTDDDPRIIAALAGMLRAEGRTDAARSLLADYARTNPISLRAKRMAAG